MPIHNTTLVAPTAKVAPLSSNPVSRENTTLGAVFGEILSDQNQLLPQGEALATSEIELIEGGKLLQPGGKNLPEFLATATATAATITTTLEPAMVAIEAPLPVVDISPPTIDPNFLKTLPDSEQLPIVPVDQLTPVAAPLINPEAYQLSKQSASATLPKGDPLAVQVTRERAASVQIARADMRQPLDGAIVMAPLERDEAMSPTVRALGAGYDQPAPKSFLDVGIQSRQAQLTGSSVEVNTGIVDSQIGRDLSQAKMPALNSTPIAGPMGLAVGQTDGAVAVKMAAGSTMTMAPGEPSWNNEFAARVSMVVKNGVQEASLQLNPPELGRLDVKISTDGDQAKILFNVQNVAAKDAIEMAMPRLREMLEQGGLQLAHSEVSDQSTPQQHDSDETSPVVSGLASEMANESPEDSLSARTVVSPDALVDYYI